MNEARDTVLARIRTALSDGAAVPSVPRDYAERGPVRTTTSWPCSSGGWRSGRRGRLRSDARPAIASTLAAHGASRVVVAPDLPHALRPDGVELVEDGGLTPWELDGLDGALTTCAAACADTGTVALDGGPGQGRRAITLVPDLHVCVVTRDQVVETVPELFERLAPRRATGCRSCSCRGRPRRPTSGSIASRASTAAALRRRSRAVAGRTLFALGV